MAEAHVRAMHTDALNPAVIAVAASLDESGSFVNNALVSKLSFAEIRFPRANDDGLTPNALELPLSSAAPVDNVSGPPRLVRECVTELDLLLFGLPYHVPPRAPDPSALSGPELVARCKVVGDVFAELERRRAAEEQRLKALAEEQRLKALEEQRAKAREDERQRKQQRQRAEEQRARDRELERTRKEKERDERERRAVEQRLAKQRHDQLIHSACLQLRHSILTGVTRELCDFAARAAFDVARAEAVVEARTQLAVTAVAKRAQTRIVENTVIDLLVETVSEAWREHQQEVIRQRLLQQQQAAQRDTASAALAAAAAATAAAMATGAKRSPSVLETPAALRAPVVSSATAAPPLGLALPPGLFPASVLVTSPSPPPTTVGIMPIASPPPSMVGVSMVPNQPSTFSSSAAALKSPPPPSLPPLELFASPALMSVLGALPPPPLVAPTPSPPPALANSVDLPTPPGLNELPSSFGFVEATTVLVYNLSAMRATRTDVLQLLSGCSVAVNDRFESQIRFVRNDVGGVCALVQLSSAADVKRAKERSGTLLDGRPVFLSQGWRRSAVAPLGAALFSSSGSSSGAAAFGHEDDGAGGGGVNQLDIGGDWLTSLLGPSGSLTNSGGKEESEESGRRGRLFARSSSGALEQQR
jgi:hypothetical protein